MLWNKSTPGNKKLVWFGPCYSYSGYATHNRCMLFELYKRGWEIKLMPTEEHIPEALIGKDLLLKMTRNTHINDNESICINLVPPPALPYHGAYTILFTTIESKTVHEGFYRRCTQYDEVWVPCRDNFKSMVNAGMSSNKLHIIPEGVYPEFFRPGINKLSQYKSDKFTFFFNGDWSYRKGIDVMVKAYLKCFSSTDNVRLLMLTHYQGQDKTKSEERITDEFFNLADEIRKENMPNVEFIWDYIPDPIMPELYNCADVYLFPTRGEAWGLPGIQAMSCGKPMITTKWGGQTDYCNRKNTFFIDVEKFDIMDDKVNLTVEFYQQQLFAFPSEKHLIKLLKYCYEHQDEVKRKGILAREHVAKNFNWSTAGELADLRLTAIGRKKGLIK